MLLGQRLERRLRASAEMLDDFGGREGAQSRRSRRIDAAGKPEKKAGREEMAGAGRIDEPLDRKGGNTLRSFARDDPAALLATGHDRERRVLAQGGDRSIEIRGLIEAFDFRLVGE